jgi:hypothetical protein
MPANPELRFWAKPDHLVREYESLLGLLRHERFALLELGVFHGDSLAMWRDGFPRATIVGVDVEPPEIDLGPRVHIARGDQGDRALMTDLRESLAPDGFQVVIDDASHVGVLSARSLNALFVEHLRPGGLYIIEDWGTGYFPGGSWADAAKPATPPDRSTLDVVASQEEDEWPGRMPSHDHGMVGLVKRLIDHVTWAGDEQTAPDSITGPLPVESMTVRPAMAVLRKRSA